MQNQAQKPEPKQDKKAVKLVIKTGEKAGRFRCW